MSSEPHGLVTQPWTVAGLLALLAALIYSNTFSARFVFDDLIYIVNNPRIKDLKNFLDFSGTRYIGLLSFALNHTFDGLNVFGYHLVNLLIHTTNAFLVYWLVRLLFCTPGLAQARVSRPHHTAWVALATALLFVVHPIQTQAVTYITQRLASLATLFYLLAIVCYLQWRLQPLEGRRRHLWYGTALLATVLAMKTKEISFTLPVMLLMVEVVLFWPLASKRWVSLTPFLLTLLIIPFSRIDALFGAESGVARDTTAISRPEYLFTQFRVIVTYLRLLMLPINQILDYDYPLYHSLFEPPVFVSFLFLTALLGLALALVAFAHRASSYAHVRLVGFGLLWFFLALAVESSIIPIRDVIFEHRLYLPSVGFFLALSVVVLSIGPPRLKKPWGPPGWVLGGFFCVVVLLAIAAYQRNLAWHDDISLLEDIVKKAPKKARNRLNLGSAYHERGRLEDALKEYRTTLQMEATSANAHANIGLVYATQGQLESAIQEFETALALDPRHAMSHVHLGDVYQKQGRLLEDAAKEYQTALRFAPAHALAHYKLGTLYLKQQQWELARQELEAVLRLRPDHIEIHLSLGYVYTQQGRIEDAIREYRAALILQPNNAETHINLGIVYLQQDRVDFALQEFQLALALQPDLARVHFNLGNTYYRQGRINEAIKEYERALEIQPDYEKARRALQALTR